MRFRLIPRDEGFFPLFDEAAENIRDCAERLQALLADYSDVERKLGEIMAGEQRGDEITRTILTRLNSSFVTPFDREDIHALTEKLDDVVDDILAVADLMVLHKVSEPHPEMAELAAILVEAADANRALIAKLPRLKNMEDDLAAIDRIESRADKVYRQSVARLFGGEYKAFEVLRSKDVVEALEGAVNAIEHVSDTVESILLKHA